MRTTRPSRVRTTFRGSLSAKTKLCWCGSQLFRQLALINVSSSNSKARQAVDGEPVCFLLVSFAPSQKSTVLRQRQGRGCPREASVTPA